MDHFECQGVWWLPDHPGRRVPGLLTFNADGLELVLYDALRQFEMPELGVVGVGRLEWEVEPVIHGRTHDGRDFTLLEVGGANLRGPFSETREVYRPEMALDGCHTLSDRFEEVWCSFDYLDVWADPPSITTDTDGLEFVRVTLARAEIASIDISGGSVRLVSGVDGSSGGDRINLARSTSFAVRPVEPAPAQRLVEEFVRALQDLLVFCVGRPVRMTSLRFLPVDLPDRREGTAAAFFRAVQPSTSRTPTFGDIENYTAPTILSRRNSPVSADLLLQRWFALWTRHREVLTLLLSSLYAPFMYSEHGFSSTFQSAEALHDALLPTRDVSKQEHRDRVAAVLAVLDEASLPPGTVEWAAKVLQTRNDKPLARKIEDLLKSTGPVGQLVLTANAKFPAETAGARSGVSHGGAEKTLTTMQRYWYGQVLRWIVRTRLLMELFDDPTEAQAIVEKKAPFRHCVEQIVSDSTS